MQTEWTFLWRAYDFHFTKTHTFIGALSSESKSTEDPEFALQTRIVIVPDEESPHDRKVEQTGVMTVRVPLPPESAEELAYVVARNASEEIAFRNGDFRINFGYVACKRIPENQEEEDALDGKPCSIRMQLEEVTSTPAFDGSRLGLPEIVQRPIELVAQFNLARRDTNPVSKFLGLFRVLESIASSSAKRESVASALQQCVPFQRHYRELCPDGDVDAFIAVTVRRRNQCAHLKQSTGFGYAPFDPAIDSELKPALALLEEIVYRCLERSVA